MPNDLLALILSVLQQTTNVTHTYCEVVYYCMEVVTSVLRGMALHSDTHILLGAFERVS